MAVVAAGRAVSLKFYHRNKVYSLVLLLLLWSGVELQWLESTDSLLLWMMVTVPLVPGVQGHKDITPGRRWNVKQRKCDA